MSNAAVYSVVLGLYLVRLIGLGLWMGKRTRSASDFYIGGRQLSGMISAASYAATTYSAFMMLGLAGFTYRGGVGALGFELGDLGKVFARVVAKRDRKDRSRDERDRRLHPGLERVRGARDL